MTRELGWQSATAARVALALRPLDDGQGRSQGFAQAIRRRSEAFAEEVGEAAEPEADAASLRALHDYKKLATAMSEPYYVVRYRDAIAGSLPKRTGGSPLSTARLGETKAIPLRAASGNSSTWTKRLGRRVVQVIVGIAFVAWLGWGCVSDMIVTNPCPGLLDDAKTAYDNGDDARFTTLMDEAEADGCGPSGSRGADTHSVQSDSPDPNAWNGYDLDCADVAGPVEITGDDPNGLDRDGDGIGCE
jgi:hypothetical protein